MMKPGILRAFALVAITFLPVSCVKGTGVPFKQAVKKTELLLTKQSKKEIFALRVDREERGTSFRFNEGSKWDKASVLFPLRVHAELAPLKDGNDSLLKVEAHKEGLLLKSNRGDTAGEWRGLILKSLTTEF